MKMSALIKLAAPILCAGTSALTGPVWECGFEKAGADGRPEGWTPVEQGMHLERQQNALTVSGEAFKGRGAASLRLDTIPTGFTASAVGGLEPGKAYRLSAYLKTKLARSLSGPAVFIGVRGADTARIGDNTDRFLAFRTLNKPLPEWTRVEIPFKTPGSQSETEKLYVGFSLKDAKGELLIDEVEINGIDESTYASLANASKEAGRDKPEFLLPGHIGKTDALPGPSPDGENLVMNGSFEAVTAPDMPDCWANHLRYSAFDPGFRENYRAVDENPFHGRKCFRLKGSSFHFGEPGLLDKNTLPGVLSFHARAGNPGAKLTVNLSGVNPTTFQLGDGWKQYVVNIPRLESNHVGFDTAGTVALIDAVKLELGDKATAFTPHPYEAINPPHVLPSEEAPETPFPSGKINLVKADGQAPSKTTVCSFRKEADGLVFNFECFGRKAADLVCQAERRDDIVSADDAVAVAISPSHGVGEDVPYVFCVNPKGVKSDRLGNDYSWNANWAATTRTGPESWTAELKIPYGILGGGAFFSDQWRINLIRFSASAGGDKREVSAWNFLPGQTVENSGCAVAGIDVPEEFRLSVSAPEVLLASYTCVPFSASYAVAFEAAYTKKRSGELKAALVAPDGKRRETRAAIINGVARIMFPNMTADEVTALKDFTLELWDNGKLTASRTFNARLGVGEILTLGPADRNYYSVERTATVGAEVKLSDAFKKKCELELSVYGAMERVHSKRFPAESGRLEFPVAELAPGLWRVSVKLVNGPGDPQILAEKDTFITKLAPGKHESKYNPANGMPIVDGKPFISLEIGLPLPILEKDLYQYQHYRRDIKELAARFTTVTAHIYQMPPEGFTAANIKPAKDYLTELGQAGLKLNVWLVYGIVGDKNGFGLFWKKPDEIFKREAEEARLLSDVPGVVAWSTMDEIYGHWPHGEPKTEAEVLDFHWRFKKEADPYRLYSVNCAYAGRVYGSPECADAVGGSFYTTQGYPPGAGPAGTRGYVLALKKECQRVSAHKVLRGWVPVYAINFQREPSVEEARCNLYVMLANGARTVSHYEYKPLSMALWDSFIQNKKEVEFLAPVMASAELTAKVGCSNGRVDFAAFRHDGKVYIVAVNYTYGPEDCAFDLSRLGGARGVRDCFDQREVTLKDNVILDAFKPLERHVYEIE